MGVKRAADLGYGYGFDNGWKGFSLRAGEVYSFDHDCTSIDGPSDWVDGSFTVTLRLLEEE